MPSVWESGVWGFKYICSVRNSGCHATPLLQRKCTLWWSPVYPHGSQAIKYSIIKPARGVINMNRAVYKDNVYFNTMTMGKIQLKQPSDYPLSRQKEIIISIKSTRGGCFSELQNCEQKWSWLWFPSFWSVHLDREGQHWSCVFKNQKGKMVWAEYISIIFRNACPKPRVFLQKQKHKTPKYRPQGPRALCLTTLKGVIDRP